MAEEILMPRLSDTMTEGVIAAWHKKVGDKVKKGDLLADVETDKATMELESYKDGVILYLGGETGSKIQVNQLLAVVGREGEDISDILARHSQGGTSAPKVESKPVEEKKPEAKASSATSAIDLKSIPEVTLMPRLSDTMTEGVIAEWHKKPGDPVKKGHLLADIETDKATMELESYKDGTFLYAGAAKGEKIKEIGRASCREIVEHEAISVTGEYER